MIFLARKMSNPNAFKALQELKMEMAQELGIDNSETSLEKNRKHTVTGIATKNLVAMGQKKLIDKE